jgi:hypothetical protein
VKTYGALHYTFDLAWRIGPNLVHPLTKQGCNSVIIIKGTLIQSLAAYCSLPDNNARISI